LVIENNSILAKLIEKVRKKLIEKRCSESLELQIQQKKKNFFQKN